MSCEVAALPFQAQAKYGTWSIDFDVNKEDLNLKNIGISSVRNNLWNI